MGIEFLDGFDKYSPPTGNFNAGILANIATYMFAGNNWTGNSGGLNSTMFPDNGDTAPPLFASNGFSLNLHGNTGIVNYLQKTLSGSLSRIIAGVAFKGVNVVTFPAILSFAKSGTQQTTVMVNNDGSISIRTGSQSGTAIQTTAPGLVSLTGTAYRIEADVTIGSNAPYAVYIDKTLVLSGTGNTRGDGTNNNADAFWLGCQAQDNLFDHLYVFNSSGTTNTALLNADWLIETSTVVSDVQTQWGNAKSILGPRYNGTSSTDAPGANILFLKPFIVPVNATLNSISIIPNVTSAGANLKPAVYADSSGAPGTLLSSGSQVTGLSAGTLKVANLTTPQTLTAGTKYWIGFITDTSVALRLVDAVTTDGYVASSTYASGAPGTAPTMTGGRASWIVYGDLTGMSVDWWAVSGAINTGSGTVQVTTATDGAEDLMTAAPLSDHTTSILAIMVSAWTKKSDSGAKTLDARLKSSGTSGSGGTTAMPITTTISFWQSVFETDPATSAPFTNSAANVAAVGFKANGSNATVVTVSRLTREILMVPGASGGGNTSNFLMVA